MQLRKLHRKQERRDLASTIEKKIRTSLKSLLHKGFVFITDLLTKKLRCHLKNAKNASVVDKLALGRIN